MLEGHRLLKGMDNYSHWLTDAELVGSFVYN